MKELLLCRSFAQKFLNLNPGTDRFGVFAELEKMSHLGFCYLMSHPYLEESQSKSLQLFGIDVQFKLQVDGNQLAEMGVPKGKLIFSAKRDLLKACLNCDNLELRNTIEFQASAAQSIVSHYKNA